MNITMIKMKHEHVLKSIKAEDKAEKQKAKYEKLLKKAAEKMKMPSAEYKMLVAYADTMSTNINAMQGLSDHLSVQDKLAKDKEKLMKQIEKKEEGIHNVTTEAGMMDMISVKSDMMSLGIQEQQLGVNNNSTLADIQSFTQANNVTAGMGQSVISNIIQQEKTWAPSRG
ncbi:MAG: hypothetical protein S4CHLAM37_11740 [Chlamydiia bacterium]|nr:hypothetical protein [Chlamydiia bacterium]